ncbi:PTS system, Lactose/Cellobiose specific IIA subunit [Popillia japonica]|uniref:PTS system, Lactose/Cellobiose specific IIA subunit n=1 Tax=Popillia japonica TaxID=7064 RepID=A0AAW1H5D7_POPJA
MDEGIANIAIELIVEAGDARSCAMEAIRFAKGGKFVEAREALANANSALANSHQVQTDLIQRTARGEEIEVSLIMVHAQDHLMSGILAKDLAKEIVELHEKINNK